LDIDSIAVAVCALLLAAARKNNHKDSRVDLRVFTPCFNIARERKPDALRRRCVQFNLMTDCANVHVTFRATSDVAIQHKYTNYKEHLR
jgi:hypothetical protein